MMQRPENSPETATYPNRIGYCIKKYGYTSTEVADEIGVARRTLSYYISGERAAPRYCLEKIARLLGCEIEELRGTQASPFLTPIHEQKKAGFDDNLVHASVFDLEVPEQKEKEATRAVNRLPPSLEKRDYSTSFSPENLTIGGLAINLIVLARGRYRLKEIQCFYDDTAIELPPEFESMKKALISDLEMRKANGEIKLPYNSETYKLKEFNTGYREIIDGKEVPVLRLKFGPTDYFTQMVTDLNIGNPIRERYAKAASVTEHPVPEFASLLGINLNLITKDGFLILTERSSQAFVAGGRLHTSVGENLLRPLDAGQSGAPDPFRCALRGAQEELGIPLNDEDVVFSALTVIPDFCQYSLISTIQIQQTRTEIEEMWRFAIPPDKWESRHLLFYPHDPDPIAQFTVSTRDQWFDVALAAVVLSLLDVGYSPKQIDAAFLYARSKMSMGG